MNNLQDHEINNYMSTATVQCIVEVYNMEYSCGQLDS